MLPLQMHEMGEPILRFLLPLFCGLMVVQDPQRGSIPEQPPVRSIRVRFERDPCIFDRHRKHVPETSSNGVADPQMQTRFLVILSFAPHKSFFPWPKTRRTQTRCKRRNCGCRTTHPIRPRLGRKMMKKKKTPAPRDQKSTTSKPSQVPRRLEGRYGALIGGSATM